MTQVVLTLNAGSSNLKYAIYSGAELLEQDLQLATNGKIEFNYNAQTPLADAVDQVVALVQNQFGEAAISVVGHRVVHGGDLYSEPVVVTDSLLEELQPLIPLAPLHLPAELQAVAIIQEHFPSLRQVLCFDTAFHRSQLPLARWFALNRELHKSGVKRYGFHGLSYHYISTVLHRYLPPKHRGRVVVAHLGNGASLCAMANGQSVTTTMGFTALDGLMMGTRCGELDAGVVLHLCQERGYSLDDVQKLLYKKSGLLGVSGISSDMRELEQSDAPEALEARELFCLRAAQKLSGLLPALGGLDAIVFTGGIGEHSASTRAMIVERLGWLGARLNSSANEHHQLRIHENNSQVGVYVIPTNEEIMIAEQARVLLASN